GATFVVELPIVAVRGPRADDAPERRPRAGSRLDGLRVLVVDDESDAREVVALVLRERGAEVHLAGSVAEALALLDRRAIEVRVRAIAAGFEAHATKPLNPDDLVELIAKLPRA